MLFKRNKTLRTPEAQKKKDRERKIKGVFFTILILLLIGGPIYLARLDKFQIKSIRIEGNSVTKEEEIQRVILEDLSGNYLWVFPKSNTLLYPKKSIETSLKTQIPRLETVSVSLLSAQMINVSVKERQPFALYCKQALVEGFIDPANCFFLDDKGFIFAEAPDFSGDVYTIYSLDLPLENPLSRTYLEEKKFKNIARLIEELKGIGVQGRVFLIKGDEYHLYLPNAGDIMWKATLDPDQMFNNLSSFLSDKAIASETNFLDKILYIDMRFGNKIFYKFRE